MSSQDESIRYKPGTIKSIKLINFMCHESFELPLGPNVNFIIGPNGSGKSALLTALTVALGARATITTRGKKASDFIKYGARYAKITLVIHNYDKIMTKDQAFKPDDYGKTITVEKTLYRDEASKLALKNDKDKRISERKQELDEMLDHFGIVVNNPICILNQEVSKTFLHSKKPEDKFELFMKATNLEQIEQDYESANMSFKEWNNSNNQKNISFALLDKEYASCEEKVSFLMQSAKLQDYLEELNKEFIFATDIENEELQKKFDKQMLTITKAIQEAEHEAEKRRDKIKKFEEDLEISRKKLASINQELEESRKKVREVQSKEMGIKTQRSELKHKIERLRSTISRQKTDKKSLQKSIEEKKRELQDQNSLDNDIERRKLEIDSLSREIPNEQAREKTLRSHTAQLSESMTTVRSELHAANVRLNELRGKRSQQEAILRRLRNGQESTLRKFGDNVMRIHEEIERAHAAGRFKRKPVGPLGYYLKLKSPDISEVLELHLGKNAHAFTCDNHQDMSVLTSIFRKVASNRPEFRFPVIITRPFGQRHNIQRFKAYHHEYKTLLDYLEFDCEPVHNALVDRCFLESVLFIPEYHRAEALMIDQKAIPQNTRLAYTKDCSTMHPRTAHGGYRSFACRPGKRFLFSTSNINEIKETEREIANLDADIRDAENIARNTSERLNEQRREYDKNLQETMKLVAEIRKKEEHLLSLKTTIAVQPEVLSALEEELEILNNSIAAAELEIEKHTETLSLRLKELEEISKEKESCKNLMDIREQNMKNECSVIEQTRASIRAARTKIEELSTIIKNRESEKASLEVKINEHLEKLARTKQQINEDWPRPGEIRRTEVITAELNKVNKQIEIQREENQDPEEVIRNLTKRMEEIRNLTQLKEKNASNFKTCERKLSHRKEGFSTLRSNTIAAVSTTFATVMRTMKMNGVLRIHLDDVTQDGEVVKKARTLEMRIDTNYTPSQRVGLVMSENDGNNNTSRSQPEQRRRTGRGQSVAVDVAPSRPKRARTSATDSGLAEKENEIKMTDTRSLSGGERSFSTVAFVLALWHHCASPFKLMDEIDVFMDMVTRRISYNALIRFAQHSEDPGQFIFFSPLELPKIDNSGSHVRVFEMPTIIRKRPHSQINEGGDEQS